MKPRTIFLGAIVVAVLLSMLGCGKGDSSFSLLADTQTFKQTKGSYTNKLDILFVVNAEPSMSSHQAALIASMNTFMSTFQSKGYDFKIAVVTSSGYMADPTLNGYDPANEDAADFNDYDGTTFSGVHVITPADPDIFAHFAINAKPDKNPAGQDGRSFSSFRQALQSTTPINLGFLRPDSFLAVIIVDNSEDFSGNGRCNGCNVSGKYSAPTLDPVSVYVDYLTAVTGTSGATARFNVSAMTQSVAPCQGGALMTRIVALATLTNGIVGDICQADYGASMAQMADQIASLSTQFILDRVPVVSSIVVTINAVTVPQDSANGWTYNPDANSIVFHGSSVPPQDALINVDFDPVTIK